MSEFIFSQPPVPPSGVALSIATTDTRTNTAYGTLTHADQATGIVLPTNGLIQVWYQAMWQESVLNAARAAIFVGSNQTVLAPQGGGAVAAQAAATVGTNAATAAVLCSMAGGLKSGSAVSAYTGDVTTGQIVGIGDGTTGSTSGPCYIFAAAGTYTVSVQFKASSGSVTVSNRKLWVQVVAFPVSITVP